MPIIVIGHRPLYVVPERTLGEGDISAYGVSDVGELLNEITSENGETPDEPMILVNGKRVGGLGDISNYPPEVVSEVQVLPRGSATRIGGSPDRRVYNIVLKRKANVVVGRAALRVATEGDWTGRQSDITYTNIHGERRINGAVRVHDDDALLESDRDIIEPVGSPDDLGRFRTLQPRSSGYKLSLSGADQLTSWLNGTAAVQLSSNVQRSLLGLGSSDLPLARRGRTLDGGVDLSLDANVGSWLISWTGNYDYDRQRILTGGALPGNAAGTITTVTSTSSSDLSATGPIFDVPAGQVRLSLGANLSRDSVSGGRPVGSTGTGDRLVEWTKTVSTGVDIPLASRINHFVGALGELTASVQLRRSAVSHFGTLSNQTFALAWQPAGWLRLFGSITTGKTPPQVASLAAPLLETPGVTYFDPLRNETVEVTQVSGGNPDLVAPSASNRHLAANLKPFRSVPLQLSVDYSSVRNRDIITVLPPASDLIILAFPERFIRDASGVLTNVDVRPVQFAREDQDQLHYGINLNLPLGSSLPGARSNAAIETVPGDNDESAAATTSQTASPSAHPRLQFNLSHTLLLKSDLQIRTGIDPVDLLSSNAIGIRGAGRPRNQFDFSIGYAERGLGLRFAGQYRSKSYLRLVGDGQTDVLRFSPLATFSIRAWAEPTRFFPEAQWLKSSRFTLSVVNITDRRQAVRNSAGLTPLAYQPAYRDPLGRTIEFELRKVF